MRDAVTRKRLGQYFSGSKVANLLVDLCALTGGEFVIDPMAGVGDMLNAVIQSGVPAENISGIEIDPNVGSRCKKNIAPGKVYIGDAFSPEPYLFLKRMAWDLVITNPPYVRYQSMSRFESDGISLKTAKETRWSLNELVDGMTHLNDDEKVCFKNIIRNYSGLSDLAVPAWILCAALAKVGGRIAIVVPESWMSRDYALSVKYMLLKFFDIEYIVEDMNSVWFPDALVKTNLIVAKRAQFRESLNDIGKLGYKHIRLGAELVGENSLVENLAVNGREGNAALKSLLNSNGDISGEYFEIRHIHFSSFLSEMTLSQTYEKLLKKLEPDTINVPQTYIPKELQKVIGCEVNPSTLTGIETWGFQVGQGLRTGANKFFYAQLLRSKGNVDYLVVDKIFKERIVPVSQKYLLPAFRYQRDVRDGLVISKSMLSHRLLYIQEDFYTANGHLQDDADIALAEYIAIAENTPINSNGHIKRIPELSAVKPNIRNVWIRGDFMRRHWFMLPPLTDRHTPQLCISRVNHKNAKCYLITDEGIVVDANFSTLWTVTGCKQKVYAMFALLNSTWIQCCLEEIATVMGGGALKVEAAHIRKLLLPFPTDELIASLFLLGKRLAKCEIPEINNIILEIDKTVLHSLLGSSNILEKCVSLRDYLQSKVDVRQR